jgi:DNA-binding response OmpR family regulator
VAIRVLIIDDDRVLLDMMARALKSAGFIVRAEDNGRKGLDALRTFAADLVITDIVMPEIEGIGVILQVRRLPEPPKVVAISGAGSLRTGDYLSWATHLGADAVLAKPFRMSEIVKLSARLTQHPSIQAKRVGA